MKPRSASIVIAAMALVFLALETALFAATFKTSDYWVMRDGYNEVFQSSLSPDSMTVEYGEYSPYIQEKVFHVDYPGPLLQFLRYDDEGSLVYYGATFDDSAQWTRWTYQPYSPQIFFPAFLDTDEPYRIQWNRKEYKGGSYMGDGSDSFTITVTEEPGVEVPAGVFDTVRVDVLDRYRTWDSTQEKTSYRTYWLAKGIGWVKMVYEYTEYQLLVSPLTVTPQSLNLKEGDKTSLSVTGGTIPYTAVSNNPSLVAVMAAGDVVYVEAYIAGDVTITVQDSAGGIVGIPVTVIAAYAPAAPVLWLTTSNLTVAFGWDAVTGATGYVLACAPYPGGEWYVSADVGLQSYFSVELPEGSAYYVWVHSYNSAGWSGPSNTEWFAPVTPALQVTPTFLTVEAGKTGYCAISGGTGPYEASSSETGVAQGSVSGGTLNVLGVMAGSATITVYDNASISTTVSVTITPPTSCSYALTSASATFDSSGGTGSAGLSTIAGCAWSASSNAAWVSITSGSIGNGSGTVYYSVSSNSSASSRTGTLTIAGQTFTVTQAGFSGGTYTNSLGQTFVLIPAGTFTMGSPSNEPGRYSDETQHQVTLTQPFYMQTTEVTQAQWETLMGSNPSRFSGCPTCPVEQVSWNDIQEFITKLNARGEGKYSLPTEAQWEYAARAGSTTAFYNGGITETGGGYDPNLDVIGWYYYNSNSKTHPVGQKAPNAWGLYDMSGNVYEWCSDWYGTYPSTAVTDPTGPSSGSSRV